MCGAQANHRVCVCAAIPHINRRHTGIIPPHPSPHSPPHILNLTPPPQYQVTSQSWNPVPFMKGDPVPQWITTGIFKGYRQFWQHKGDILYLCLSLVANLDYHIWPTQDAPDVQRLMNFIHHVTGMRLKVRFADDARHRKSTRGRRWFHIFRTIHVRYGWFLGEVCMCFWAGMCGFWGRVVCFLGWRLCVYMWDMWTIHTKIYTIQTTHTEITHPPPTPTGVAHCWHPTTAAYQQRKHCVPPFS